ncbi:hypothetical protein EXW72_06285 [Pseudomonas sp. BCA14]|nr:hypothetical protein EXW70_06205 [Pseudomonas sp. JMN1]TFF16342.1 hypothetical protein EXW71_02835 [Pseudomonas sp. BCA17]TFF32139.1 hypothetical protein EXW72_06285 [Pseudomonas sp. BCA14]TFF33212.1 hypothetical protein EXW73_02085 [Pseudomonas sp. BCA13]
MVGRRQGFAAWVPRHRNGGRAAVGGRDRRDLVANVGHGAGGTRCSSQHPWQVGQCRQGAEAAAGQGGAIDRSHAAADVTGKGNPTGHRSPEGRWRFNYDGAGIGGERTVRSNRSRTRHRSRAKAHCKRSCTNEGFQAFHCFSSHVMASQFARGNGHEREVTVKLQNFPFQPNFNSITAASFFSLFIRQL